MRTSLAAFYHVYADGAWPAPLSEFLHALDSTGFDGVLAVGIIGKPENRRRVSAALIRDWAPEIVAEGDTGYEACTLNAVRAYARTHYGDVMYAHTKGASRPEPFRDRWRRSMTTKVVRAWRSNQDALKDGVDAVGCHWLTEAAYPGMFGPMTIPTEGSGFFGGNYWIARCSYLRTLPPCPEEPRWAAESWIGLNKPRVVDLLPGWPHDNRWPELCS